jgi:hypothetical protein
VTAVVGWQVQLGEDAPDVFVHRTFGDVQPGRDGGVRMPLGHQGQNLAFARAQARERTDSTVGDQLRDDERIDSRATGGDPAQRLKEFVHSGHSVLQEVSHPTPAIRQQLGGVRALDVLGQNQDRKVGVGLAGAGIGGASVEARASSDDCISATPRQTVTMEFQREQAGMSVTPAGVMQV